MGLGDGEGQGSRDDDRQQDAEAKSGIPASQHRRGDHEEQREDQVELLFHRQRPVVEQRRDGLVGTEVVRSDADGVEVLQEDSSPTTIAGD